MEIQYFSHITSKTFAFIFFLVFSNFFVGNAQVTTNSGSGLAASYPTLTDAITALNTATITAPVIITLAGNETAPAGGYEITAQGTATNMIIIEGNASTITASNAHVVGSITDAVFKLIGAHYVTLQNFTMQENVVNTVNTLASNTKTEFGVALFYASTTNGSQNNTIQNNTISLDRLYQNSFGIYSNPNHTATNASTLAFATAFSGSNSYNKFYTNSISNVNIGINLTGPGSPSMQDVNNDIGGGSALTGNTITNWGSNSLPNGGFVNNPNVMYGILVQHQKGYNISNNILTSATAIQSAVIRGLYQLYTTVPTGTPSTFTNTISNNQITLNSANTSGTIEHINTSIGVVTASLNITNNTFLNSVVSGLNSNVTVTGINASDFFGVVNITNNTIKGWTSSATTGGFTGIRYAGSSYTTLNINNNKIGEDATPGITFSVATSGPITGIVNITGSAAANVSISNNDFRGIVQNVIGSGVHNYISNNVAVANLTVSDNTFTNIVANTNGAITLVSHSYTIPVGGSQTFNNNRIVSGFNKAAPNFNVTVFYSVGSSQNGTTTTYTNNNFSNITATGASILGINNSNGTASSGSNRIVTGNVFSNWTGPAICSGISFNHIGANSTISNNTISNFNSSSNFIGITGISIGNTYSGGNPLNINNNTITQLTGTGTAPIAGLVVNNNSPVVNILDNTILNIKGGATSVRGLVVQNGIISTISRNKISNLEGTATNSIVTGINLLGAIGTQFNITNNFIGNLTNPSANNTVNAIIGLNSGSAAGNFNLKVYHNTIYLNATSIGANFSTSAMYHTTNTTATVAALDLRNNFFVNTSTANGIGSSVAYRRSGTELANFDTTSNNNNFVAPILFADGTNFDTTIDAYKIRVAPRETNSMSEAVNFLSTNPIDANYLHINPAIPTPLESSVVSIESITTDFDLNIRQGQVGYTGTGTAPDMGADEFEGIACSVKPSVSTTTIYYAQNAIASPLTATGTNLLWYTTATGGTGSSSAPTPITTSLGTTSYWVSQNTMDCESERVKIDVRIVQFASHLNFNATTDFVDIGTGIATAIAPLNTITVEAWVYPTAISNGLGNNYGMIVGNYNTTGNLQMQFMLRKEGTDYTFWIANGGGFSAVGAINGLVLNTWQHIAGVCDGNSIKIYINGVLINSTSSPLSSFGYSINPIRMGINNSNEKFVGNIDEVRIWSRALTQAEIIHNMNCELASGQLGLLAYYKFNQGIDSANNATVNTITDSSGNNYNGTLNGFALNGTTSNWKAGSTITSGNECTTYLASNSFDAESFNYYPNPTSGILNISYSKEISEVAILNLIRQTVLTQKGSDLEMQLDLSSLSSGTYLVRITSEGQSKTIKVIKQ